MERTPFDIQVQRKGANSSVFSDFYHHVLSSSWFDFLLATVVIYLGVNGIFAFLYYVGGANILNANPESYWDAFLFSFQTSTTIGYGHFLPVNAVANFIMIFDTLAGVLIVALTTGMAFAKLSRLKANVLFSNNVLFDKFNGQPALIFRVANARSSHVVDASIGATIVVQEETKEGVEMQRLYDLKLLRRKTPVFFLSWTVVHIIDEKSPLYGWSHERMREQNMRITVSFTGIDDGSAQLVHTNHFYRFVDVLENKRFADVIHRSSSGLLTIDYSKFHEVL